MRSILLITLVISIFISCKKQESENAILNFSFKSIYNIEKIKVGVFEGWVDASTKDLNETAKEYFAILKSDRSSFKEKMKEGRYTLIVHYEDFGIVYKEKVDLKRGNNDIALKYDKRINLKPQFNSFIYNKTDTIYTYFQSLNPRIENYGVDLDFTINYKKAIKNSRGHYQYKIISPGMGKNIVSLKIKYPDGTLNEYKYNIIVLENNTISNVWKHIDLAYYNQDIFSQPLVSVKRDTIVNGNTIFKNTIIEGLQGVYYLKFSNNQLEEIKITHGNVANEPTLKFATLKDHFDTLFGTPTKISYNSYKYSLEEFFIHLSESNSKIESYIYKN